MKTTRIIRMILIVGGAMLGAAGRAEAGSLAINVQLGGGSYATVPAPLTVPVAAPTIGTPVTMMWNNQPAGALAGYAGTGRYFRIDVPEGQTYLNVLTAGGWGDCDVYLARGYLPTPSANEFAATDPGTEQQVTVLYPAAGTWYMLVHGAQQFGDVSLMSSFWQQANIYYDEPAGTYVPFPAGTRNARVCIAWDRLGWRRGDAGLISFIQGELREHREIRHHIMQPAPVQWRRDVPAASRIERLAPTRVVAPAVIGRNTGSDRPAASRVERLAVSQVERPAASQVERPAVNRIDRPAASKVERPAATERNLLQDRPAVSAPRPAAPSHVEQAPVRRETAPAPVRAAAPVVQARPTAATHAATPAPVRAAAPVVQARPAAVTHAAAPAPVAARAQRIETTSTPAPTPTPTRARATAPEPTPTRVAAPAPVAVTRAKAAEPVKDRQTAALRDRQTRDGR